MFVSCMGRIQASEPGFVTRTMEVILIIENPQVDSCSHWVVRREVGNHQYKMCLPFISTIEAEYIAVAESFKEAKWPEGLVGEMCNKLCSVSVHYDSQRAIHLARNKNTFNSRSKHTDIKYNFIQNEVEHKKVILNKN